MNMIERMLEIGLCRDGHGYKITIRRFSDGRPITPVRGFDDDDALFDFLSTRVLLYKTTLLKHFSQVVGTRYG